MAENTISEGYDAEMSGELSCELSCELEVSHTNSVKVSNASRSKQFSSQQSLPHNQESSKVNGPQALSTDPRVCGAQPMEIAGSSQHPCVSTLTSLDSSMTSFSTNVNLSTYVSRLKYVDEANLKKSFSCALCANIVHEPRQTHCGQRVCLECIEMKFTGAETILECPLSHDEEEGMDSDDEMNYPDGFRLSDFPPDRYARTHLLKQKVFCPNDFCKEEVTQKRLPEHLVNCDFTKRRCENENCELRAHQSRSSLEQCSARANLKGACGYQAYRCENQEETNAAYRDHISSKVRDHLEKITLHLESSKRNMPNGDDPLSVNQKVRPLDYTVADLHDVTTKMKVKMQETEAARGGLDNMDNQMKVLVADMNIVIDEQKSGDTQLDDLIRGLERTIDKRQTEINNWSASVPAGSGSNSVGSNMGSVTSGNSITSSKSTGGARSENLSTSNLSIPASLASSNMSSSCTDFTNAHGPPSLNGELVWVISDFTAEMRRDAAKKTRILSSIFYTGRHGYKLRAEVDLCGDEVNRCCYMALYLVLMPGYHDGSVQWPFQRRVVFAIVNPNKPGIGEKRRVFVPDGGVAFQRPIQQHNPAFGYPDFMSIDEVEENYVDSRGQLCVIITVSPRPTYVDSMPRPPPDADGVQIVTEMQDADQRPRPGMMSWLPSSASAKHFMRQQTGEGVLEKRQMKKYKQVVEEKNRLQLQVEQMQTEKNILQTGYDNLQTENNNLQTHEDNLLTGYNNLLTECDNLREMVQILESAIPHMDDGVGESPVLAEDSDDDDPMMMTPYL